MSLIDTDRKELLFAEFIEIADSGASDEVAAADGLDVFFLSLLGNAILTFLFALDIILLLFDRFWLCAGVWTSLPLFSGKNL